MTDRQPGVVGVRFRNAGKIFYFHTAGMRLENGEYVVVETMRGPELARVIIAPDQVVVNELGREDLKPVLRLATDDDLRRMDGLKARAEELLPEARRLAEEARFPARIDTADFTLDGRRLTFSFTSEERLDFREFLRRAGDRFGAKVDMRQLGSRDRARLAGGYGICGRELCCSGWLTTFPAISIRMAKEQDLPLNPQKISGLCGRLLCCLSYEEDGYREMRKSLPRQGQRCSTPTGEGRVIEVNILRRSVTLVVDGQRIQVGDRDLGTVVRWDTASKSGDPPPSLTRAEAVAAGLLDASELLEESEVETEIDWITGEPRGGGTGVEGRGRLPGGGPRKTIRPRPATPEAAQAPPAQRATDRAADRRPGRDRPREAPREARPAQPQPPGGAARSFRRAAPGSSQGTSQGTSQGAPGPVGDEQSAQEPREGGEGARRGRGRRGRGRGSRGGGGDAGNPPTDASPQA